MQARSTVNRQIGVVVDLWGNVSSEEPGGALRLLTKGARIRTNELIRTSVKSGVDVRLDGGVGLRLGAEGDVKVTVLTPQAGGTIVLGEGPLLIERGAPADGSAGEAGLLVVETPYGTITLDGDARVFTGPSNQAFGIFVDRGGATVTADGQKVSLKQGEGSDVRKPGGPATPPTRWVSSRIDVALESVQPKPAEQQNEKK